MRKKRYDPLNFHLIHALDVLYGTSTVIGSMPAGIGFCWGNHQQSRLVQLHRWFKHLGH